MHKTRICYIIGAGEHFDAPPPAKPDDLVIAADGGYAYMTAQGLKMDLVLGDFDSLGAPPSGDNITVLPQEKDDTDMVAAIRTGWQRGFRTFHIYGGTGGRLDHTLANIQCIADIADRGGRGYLFDRDTVITALKDGIITFPASAKGTLSAFAHTDTATGVYEKGLKYPLTDATLRSTYPVGISNEFTGVPASVSVGQGTLIIIYPKDTQEVSP